jgi:hypothetical protein
MSIRLIKDTINDKWCGYYLTRSQKVYLTKLSFEEMEKPIGQRKKPHKLIEMVRHLIKE